MTNDINIVGRTIVTAHGSVEGAIGICGQTILFISSENELLPANRTMDARGCLVMPGMIDAHVYVRAPSFSYRENF
jgi:dihydroorotase